MAKKKNTTKPDKKAENKAQKLEFKDKFLNSEAKMYGQIKGVNLPKMFKDFTDEEKTALYWHNPEKTKTFFKNVSFLGARKLNKNEEKPKPPTVNDEQEDKQETDK
jgi:hypothetical protein